MRQFDNVFFEKYVRRENVSFDSQVAEQDVVSKNLFSFFLENEISVFIREKGFYKFTSAFQVPFRVPTSNGKNSFGFRFSGFRFPV